MERLKSLSVIFAILAVLILGRPDLVSALTKTGKASWYSVASCRREGTSGIMANGRRLNDGDLTCASWDYSFGTVLRVTNCANQKSVRVVVTDRGPARRLYRRGRIIDLSKAAFDRIANLKEGIISVEVEKL